MADEKGTQKPKERVKYKFGQNDIDLTNYIHNLGTNVQSYLNSKNWNEGQKQEFMNAYNRYLTGLQDQLANNTNRFTTDDFGSIIDSTGALSNTDNDDIDPVGSEYYYDNKGNRITTDDFNLLKKRKQKNYNTFSANREVATYFNTIGNALKGIETPKEKVQDVFNLSKHGFLADWTTTNNPAGGDFNLDPYLEKDAMDETTGKRGTSNRAAYLKEQIENYINNIGEYDFSSSPFKNRDTYISRLRAAAQNLENGYNSEDVIALNQAGIGNEFLSKFFATGATENLGTEAQQAAQYIEQQQKQEEEQKVIDQANRLRAMSELNQYIKDNPFKPKDSGFLDGGDYDAESVLQDIERNYSDIEGDDNKVKAWINFGQLLKDLRNPVIEGDRPGVVTRDEAIEKMKILRGNIAKKLKFAAREGYMKSYGNDEYIIPGSEDYNNYSVMTYNPNTGEYKDQSILLNEKLREAMAYDWYKKNHTAPSNKNGGILSYLQEGGFMKRAREARQQRKQQEQPQQKVQQEQEDNRTKEQKEAGQRKISDGLSGTDIARLAAIGMDLTSAISSFVPGAGTAVSGLTGIGSTLTTFGADIAEDGFQWSDLGNAGVGLGMDIVGMIPGFGAAGKASKIGKQLVKFAPYVLGALQAQNALSESSRKSWKKIIDGSFKDLTVDDLRNLASGITAFTSLSNQAGVRLKNSAMRSATKTGDLLISDKTGKMLRITPEKLEEIKNAQSLKDANKILQSIPGYEGKELASNFKQGFFAPVKRMFDNDPKVADHYDWDKLRGTVFDRKGWLPSDANVFQSVSSSNLGNIELHLKNPYSKLLDKPKKPNKNTTTKQQPRFDKLRQLSSQTDKLTPQEIAVINRQRVKSKKGKLTEQEIQALNQRRQNRAGDGTDNSFQARLQRYKDAKREGKFTSVEDDIKRAKDELAEANLNTPEAKQALANQIADQRAAGAINRNADNVRTQQLRELAAQTLSKQVPPIPKAPLRGKVYTNKEKFYNELFSDDKYYPTKVITQPQKLQLVPEIPRKPSKAQHNSRQKLYDKLFGIEPTIPKTTKGLVRAQRKQEAASQKLAQEYIDKAKKLSKEKEINKKINWEQTKRELPHKQSNKKKKTSRDDRRTVRREDGGTLDLVRVRKFKYAGKFPEWYSKLYKFQNLTGWNNSLNQSLAGPSITNENAGHYRAGDLNEAYTKNNSYTSNPNLVGQDLQSYYDSSFKGKSLDDYVSAYNANAAKIRGYWDQERTYKQSGAQEHNRLFKNMFGNRSDNSNNVWNIGYDSNLEDIVGSSTWLRRMDRYEKEFDNLSDEEKKSRIHKIDLGDGNFGYVYKKANGDIAVWNQPETPATSTNPADSQTTPTITSVIQPSQEPSDDNKQNKSFFSNINPTIAYGLPRAVYADRMNRRITDLAKESVVPLLKDPFEVHRYTRSDLDAEMQGERDYANLRRLASRPITSDGSLQTATQLQAEVQGQEARTAGKEKSNQVQRQYDELAWQQEKENAANRHETAMFNRAQQWGADQDKSKYEQAYLAKKFNIWDVFGQQLEYDARTKQKENKALEYNFARSDIHNTISYAPNDYGANLTPDELTVWNKVLSGTNPSSLSSQEFNSYKLAAQKVSRAETEQLRQYYNVPNTRWSKKTPDTPWSPTMSKAISAKNGAKIAVAGIEAKTADAERFQKQIKECIDRNEKAIDRLSKSLYGLIKASMIK